MIKKRKPIVPKLKWCKNCGKHRVKHHHYYCNICHKLLHMTKKEKEEAEIKEF
jgi:hypothetical protein